MLEGVVKLKVFVLNDSIFTDIMHYKRLFTFGSDRIDRKPKSPGALTERNRMQIQQNWTELIRNIFIEPNRILQQTEPDSNNILH